jgi:hypothetical protein
METIGSLIDKLTVVELKIFHTNKLLATDLVSQKERLCKEINKYVIDATVGKISPDDMTYNSNKVYDDAIRVAEFSGELGELVSSLSYINCCIWHEVDKSYHPEIIPPEELAPMIKELAILNLRRNRCIDAIDKQFKGQVML